jgi:hypothetical protein
MSCKSRVRTARSNNGKTQTAVTPLAPVPRLKGELRCRADPWRRQMRRAQMAPTRDVPEAARTPARAVELIGLGHGRPRSVRSQDAHLAPRRATDLQGHIIVCEPSPVLMAYYRYDVDLRDAIFTG